MAQTEIVEITWAEFLGAINVIEMQLKAQSQIRQQSVLGIGRGGLILATILSHKLKVPLACIMSQGYDENDKPLEKIKVSDIIGTLKYPVLIIDDIFDRGITLKTVLDKLEKNDHNTIAVAVTKLAGKKAKEYLGINNFIAPIKIDKEKWVVLPWESKE